MSKRTLKPACSDAISLEATLKQHITCPDNIYYRENVSKGPAKIAVITQHKELLKALREGPLAQRVLTQKVAEAVQFAQSSPEPDPRELYTDVYLDA